MDKSIEKIVDISGMVFFIFFPTFAGEIKIVYRIIFRERSNRFFFLFFNYLSRLMPPLELNIQFFFTPLSS